MDDLNGVEIIVSGFVQGVGFRYFIYKNALLTDIKGFVKNLPDGSVFIKAEGSNNAIVQLIELASKGPAKSIVKNKKIIYKDFSGEFEDFSIK